MQVLTTAPHSSHRCAARGWRELLRALEHERCLGLRPLIALDAAVTTAAAMAAAADANAGTTDARSVNAGASDARSVNRTLAAVGSGRTESHRDVGIGLRLSHSDVGIGLIFTVRPRRCGKAFSCSTPTTTPMMMTPTTTLTCESVEVNRVNDRLTRILEGGPFVLSSCGVFK